MAKYDREFLVPYLQDVCALHYAELEVACKMFETKKQILQIKQGRKIEPPEEPIYEEEGDFFDRLFAGAGVLLMVMTAILLISGLLMEDVTRGELGLAIGLAIIGIPLGWFLWHIFGAPMKEAQKNNKVLYEQYQDNMTLYLRKKNIIEQENEIERQKIPGLEEKVNVYSAERGKIKSILEKAYSAAVLPTQYRDIYAATYLYDYFSNSRADDLDQVLNTYVLEQIKDKLDEIIENQRVSILQQRMILVNQQRFMEEQRAHNEYMRSKIRQIASSVEEVKQYLSMVECNTAASAYFSAANYLR